MRMLKVVVIVAPIAAFAGLMYGCGTGDRPGAAGDGTVLGAGRCPEPGATRECHQLVGTDNGVRTCMVGVQRCEMNGAWGACFAANDGLFESSFGPSGGGLRFTAVSTASPDASACANPCDPYCVGFDEDAGPTTLDASTSLDDLVPFPGTNPGFEDKLLQDNCPGHNYTAKCDFYPTGNANTSEVAAACQADSYCESISAGGSGCCKRFNAGEHHDTMPRDAVKCTGTGPDLTLGGACKLGGKVVVPACNRGNAPVSTGTVLRASTEVPNLAQGWDPTPGACWPAANDNCSITLAAPLNPGDCEFFIEGTNCTGMSGNKLMAVNSRTSPIAECPLNVNDAISTTNADQLGCWNNITAFNSSQVPVCPTLAEPKIFTQTYTASCRPDERVQWGTVSWKATTPGLYNPPAVDLRSEILFDAHVRETYPDGGTGPYTPLVRVGETRISNRSPDPLNPDTWGPNNCVSGVAGCPKQMFTKLGGVPYAHYQELELQVSMYGAALYYPTLISWYVTYSCVPYE